MPHEETPMDWKTISRVHFHLPNETHGSDDDDWDSFEAINDPSSGKKLPDEVHGTDDEWDSFEAINDPASGKKLPDEVHGCVNEERAPLSSTHPLKQEIYVTEKCISDAVEIYGDFTASDDEYPAMGIVIQGSPVFVECVRFPDSAVIRRKFTDEVKRAHPDVAQLWQSKLNEYEGRCRTSTIHIHPMGLAALSSTDVHNFDALRVNPDDPSPYPNEKPYPVVLVNLNNGSLELLGFWVMDGAAYNVPVQAVLDSSSIVSNAWKKAQPLPFFTAEARAVSQINRLVSKAWQVEFATNTKTGEQAIKAIRDDGAKVLIRFAPETPFGLDISEELGVEQFVDWTRLLNTLAQSSPLPSKPADKPTPSRPLLITRAMELFSPKNIELKRRAS